MYDLATDDFDYDELDETMIEPVDFDMDMTVAFFDFKEPEPAPPTMTMREANAIRTALRHLSNNFTTVDIFLPLMAPQIPRAPICYSESSTSSSQSLLSRLFMLPLKLIQNMWINYKRMTW